MNNLCACVSFEVCFVCLGRICTCTEDYNFKCNCLNKCYNCKYRTSQNECVDCKKNICFKCVRLEKYCVDCFKNRTCLISFGSCTKCLNAATGICVCGNLLCTDCHIKSKYCSINCEPRNCPFYNIIVKYNDHRCSYCYTVFNDPTQTQNILLLLLCFKHKSLNLILPKVLIKKIISYTNFAKNTIIFNPLAYKTAFIGSYSLVGENGTPKQMFWKDDESDTLEFSDSQEDSSDSENSENN